MNPIIKYVGGKRRLLPELTKRMPTSFGRYFEPFVGGGALFFHLELAADRATIGDANASLIDAYRALARRTCMPRIWNLLQEHARLHSKAHYLAVRAQWNASRARTSDSSRTAAYLYLGRAGFKGLWRENNAGAMNTPFGDGELHLPTLKELRRASMLLARAHIVGGEFDGVVASIRTMVGPQPADFVYLDPPYVPTSATSSFTGYSAGGFDSMDQRRLEIYARMLAARGCYVMLSNSDTPVTRELYSDTSLWRLESVSAPRSIGTSTGGSARAGEVIIRNVNVSGWGAW